MKIECAGNPGKEAPRSLRLPSESGGEAGSPASGQRIGEEGIRVDQAVMEGLLQVEDLPDGGANAILDDGVPDLAKGEQDSRRPGKYRLIIQVASPISPEDGVGDENGF